MKTSPRIAAVPVILTILLAGCGNDKGGLVIRKLDDAKHAKEMAVHADATTTTETGAR